MAITGLLVSDLLTYFMYLCIYFCLRFVYFSEIVIERARRYFDAFVGIVYEKANKTRY